VSMISSLSVMWSDGSERSVSSIDSAVPCPVSRTRYSMVIKEIDPIDERKIAAPPPVHHSSRLLGKEPQLRVHDACAVKLQALKESLVVARVLCSVALPSTTCSLRRSSP
jgi:hypothetical protein